MQKFPPDALVQLPGVPEDPAGNGGVIYAEIPLGHHLLQVAVTERISLNQFTLANSNHPVCDRAAYSIASIGRDQFRAQFCNLAISSLQWSAWVRYDLHDITMCSWCSIAAATILSSKPVPERCGSWGSSNAAGHMRPGLRPHTSTC